MRVRLQSSSLIFALVGTLVLGACKHDAPTSTESFGNPTGLLNVGDVIKLNVNVDSACNLPVYHGARVVAVGTHSVIFADTLNPPGGFTTADYQRFAAKFDTLVYPVDVDNFGAPTDVDKNGGRISIVFTRAVNQLTTAGSAQFVGGLAFSRDLFPRVGDAGGRASTCEGSNEGEYFYALTPDPAGTINGNRRTAGFVDSTTLAVLAHELQHIINSSRRLYVTNATAFEEKWLDEGLAHVAEELLFYKEAGITSRQNLNINSIRASTRILNAFNLEMSGNTTRYRLYLAAPSTHSPYADDDELQTRGAAWSFLRYSLDRLNANDGSLPGNGQLVSGNGDVVVAAGGAAGDFVATVVNTSLTTQFSGSYSLKSVSASGDLIPGGSLVPAYLHVPIADASSGPVRDIAFEARLRARERAVLTPLFAGARAWYAARNPTSPLITSRASASSSYVSDADGALLFKLVNSTQSGLSNFQGIVGNDMAGFVRDWAVSNAIDDVAALNTEYQQRSWNWHSLYPALLQSGAYPLLLQTLSLNGTTSGTLVPGGATYYRFSLPANGTATLSLGVPNGTASNSLQLVVVRSK